jgi:hypothetical protein
MRNPNRYCSDPYGKCAKPEEKDLLTFIRTVDFTEYKNVNGDVVCNGCYEMMQDHQEESKYI